jgi:hypothetical protein
MSRSQTSSTQELTAAEVRAYFDGTKRKLNSGLGHLSVGDRERLVESTGRRRERCRAPRSHRVGPMRHTATAASTPQWAPPAHTRWRCQGARFALLPYSGTRNAVEDACSSSARAGAQREYTQAPQSYVTNSACALCALAPTHLLRNLTRPGGQCTACTVPRHSEDRDSFGERRFDGVGIVAIPLSRAAETAGRSSVRRWFDEARDFPRDSRDW